MRETYKLKAYVTNRQSPVKFLWQVHDDLYRPIWLAVSDVKDLLQLSSSSIQEDQSNDRSPPAGK